MGLSNTIRADELTPLVEYFLFLLLFPFDDMVTTAEYGGSTGILF